MKQGKNAYYVGSRISMRVFRHLIRAFALDLTASDAARLVDVGYAKHLRVEHGLNQFATDRTHINGIESFWAFAKHRLAKFKGLPRSQ